MTDRTEHDGREMWQYGDAGDEYPVSDGDLWSLGPHHVSCGDVHDGAWSKMVHEFGAPDIVYTDPPHRPGDEASYRTKAGLDSDEAHFPSLIRAVARPLDGTRHVFAEASLETLEDVAANLDSRLDLPFSEAWEITYYDDKPCGLVYFGELSFGNRFTGMDDSETPREALQAVSEQESIETVGDPFSGKHCATLRAAHREDLEYVGTELHPRRLAAGLKRNYERFEELPEPEPVDW